MTLRINDNGVDRDMTEAEVAAYEVDAAIVNKVIEDKEAEKLAKQEAIAAVTQKLLNLGLTVDDLKAIGI